MIYHKIHNGGRVRSTATPGHLVLTQAISRLQSKLHSLLFQLAHIILPE